jgi:hypothetical protein
MLEGLFPIWRKNIRGLLLERYQKFLFWSTPWFFNGGLRFSSGVSKI